MLKVNEEHKSIRQVYREESGSIPILGLSLSLGEDGYNLSVELIEPAYFKTHRDEVQNILTDFVQKMNVILSEADLPRLPENQ